MKGCCCHYRVFPTPNWRTTWATPSAARNFMIVVRDTPNIAAHCSSVISWSP